jgi:kynurenine formamidase
MNGWAACPRSRGCSTLSTPARERTVSGVGVDTVSIDPGRDKTYQTHKIWLAADKWAVECVARLDRVPLSGATVVVAAPYVRDATGGPARIVALW